MHMLHQVELILTLSAKLMIGNILINCNGQLQYDINSCGVLILLAFFFEHLTMCSLRTLITLFLISGIVQW